jgi:hypothetical protein
VTAAAVSSALDSAWNGCVRSAMCCNGGVMAAAPQYAMQMLIHKHSTRDSLAACAQSMRGAPGTTEHSSTHRAGASQAQSCLAGCGITTTSTREHARVWARSQHSTGPSTHGHDSTPPPRRDHPITP